MLKLFFSPVSTNDLSDALTHVPCHFPGDWRHTKPFRNIPGSPHLNFLLISASDGFYTDRIQKENHYALQTFAHSEHMETNAQSSVSPTSYLQAGDAEHTEGQPPPKPYVT